jgi:hypothetical protein
MTEFLLGMIGQVGIVLDARRSPPEAIDQTAFEAIWSEASVSNTVFIAFARRDVEVAKKVETVLKSEGHAVFIYLNEEGGPPKYPPEFAGKMFGSAGHHFVLDTPAARMSVGVRLEALELQEKALKENADRRWERAKERESAGEEAKMKEITKGKTVPDTPSSDSDHPSEPGQ